MLLRRRRRAGFSNLTRKSCDCCGIPGFAEAQTDIPDLLPAGLKTVGLWILAAGAAVRPAPREEAYGTWRKIEQGTEALQQTAKKAGDAF